MSYKVILTDRAIFDLRKIYNWIFDTSKDKIVAKKFLNNLKNACMNLETFPNSGSLPKERVLKVLGFRYIVYKDYLVFYITSDDEKIVRIITVLNSKRDYMRIMQRYI